MILRLGALVLLVVVAVVVARAERKRQRREAFVAAIRDVGAQFTELARVMGEQLVPAIRSVTEKVEEFGRAFLQSGATKWK